MYFQHQAYFSSEFGAAVLFKDWVLDSKASKLFLHTLEALVFF